MAKSNKTIAAMMLSACFAMSSALPIFVAEAENTDESGEVLTETAAVSVEESAESPYTYTIDGLGGVFEVSRESLGASATYYNYRTVLNGVYQSAHVVVGDPARGSLVFGVSLGDSFGKRGKVSSLRDDAESENRLVAAVNADFFSTSTGVPMGVYVNEGRFVSSSDGRYSVGIAEDGSVTLGKVGDSLALSCGETSLAVSYLNKYPTVYGAYLLTRDFGSSTRLASSIAATEYVIKFEGDIVLGESVLGEVTEVRTTTGAAEIPEGCAVLVVPDIYDYSANYRVLEAGSTVELSTTVSEEFRGVVNAIGGGDVILIDGEPTDWISDEAIETSRNPRTAMGVTADGKIVIAVVDGRKTGYSSGVKMTDLAAAMKSLGCTDAINFDGGGSSVLVFYDADTSSIVNTPSDGVERSVPNAIAMYENREAAEKLHTLDFSAAETLLFSGAKIPLSLTVKNSSGDTIEVELTEENTAFTVDERFGQVTFIDGIPTFTAANSDGVGKITAAVTLGDEVVTSELFLSVTTTVDSLTLDQNMILSDSDARATVQISAKKDGREVWFGDILSAAADSEDIICTVNGREMTVSLAALADETDETDDAETAKPTEPSETEPLAPAYGKVTVTLGGKSVTIPAYFDSELLLNLGETLAPFVTVTNKDYTVTYIPDGGVMGEGAFVIESPAGEEIPAETTDIYEATETTEPTETTDSTETAEITESADEPAEEPVFEPFEVKINASGAIISSGLANRRIWMWADGLTPEALPYAVVETADSQQLVYYERYYDFLDYSGRALYTLSLEGIDGVISLKTLFAYTAYSEEQHVTLGAPILTDYLDTNLYADTVEHWSSYYVNSLSYMGIVNGSENLHGELVYTPDGGLSREQFAKILVNYLKIDVNEYADTALDFADLHTIAPWAIPYVRAAVGAGLMRGRSTPQDTIVFAPTDGITRQEALYVLGGLLSEIVPEEFEFSDSEKIALWALENLRKAYAAGLISGYDDGSIRPEGGITRAEAATVVVKLYEFSSKS